MSYETMLNIVFLAGGQAGTEGYKEIRGSSLFGDVGGLSVSPLLPYPHLYSWP